MVTKSDIAEAEIIINDRTKQFYEGTINQMKNSLKTEKIIKKDGCN